MGAQSLYPIARQVSMTATPSTTQSALSKYTAAELLEEVVRRANANEASEVKHWCEDCKNFVPKPDADDKYNPCSAGHTMSFKMPDGYDFTDYGFYRLICSDRA